MPIILSCGHREDDYDNHYSVMTKEWSRECTKAVGYKTVCLSCYKSLALSDELLTTDDEAMEWLRS
jgi:hypothetical protein